MSKVRVEKQLRIRPRTLTKFNHFYTTLVRNKRAVFVSSQLVKCKCELRG